MVKKQIEGFDNIDLKEKFEEKLKDKNEVVYLIWKVSLNLALRISDTLNITISEAERFLKEGYYLAKDKKTKKANRIPLNKNSIKALEDALKIRKELGREDNPYLFISSANRSKSSLSALSRIQVFRVYKEIVEWYNIPIQIGTHSARKTWGLLVYNKTKDIALVMQRLNHSSQAETLQYIGITEKKKKDIAEEFNF